MEHIYFTRYNDLFPISKLYYILPRIFAMSLLIYLGTLFEVSYCCLFTLLKGPAFSVKDFFFTFHIICFQRTTHIFLFVSQVLPLIILVDDVTDNSAACVMY